MGETPLDDASWIWCQEDVDTPNQYGLFRKVIVLPDQFGRVIINACADSRYWLFVNGKRVGFGPGKFNRVRPQYDTFDLSGLMQAGPNVVAFKVHSIGPVPDCSSFMPTRAGLIAAVRWSRGAVVTDATWKASPETAYAADTPRMCGHQSFIECFDARKAQVNWMGPGFDDSDWNDGYEIPPDRLDPWDELVPRPVKPLTLVPRMPVRVVETGTSTVSGGNPADLGQIAELMERAAREPSGAVTLHSNGPFPVFFNAPEDPLQAAYAVFDFGENSAGYLTFDIVGKPGTVVDVAYGEHFDRGIVECHCQGVNYVDRFILCEGHMEHQLMFPKCLHYLLVEVRGGGALMTGILQDVSTYPVQQNGSFLCEAEPSLARIWQIGAHTVRLCMEDVYMDTPRRERAGWLGDMVPEAIAAYYAFGETEVARHSLALFMDSQQPGGWISGRHPSLVARNMPTWSASYPFALADYVRHSGDVGFLGQVWSGLERLTDWFEQQRKSDDLLVVAPARARDARGHGWGYILVDWAPTRLDGAIAVMNMFYHHYLTESAWLAGQLGETNEQQVFAELADRTRRAIQQELFDDRRGVFVNCRDADGLSAQAGYQENLLALLWDIAAPEQAERIARAILPDDSPLPVWKAEGARDWSALANGEAPWPEDRLVPMGSPFFAYYALWALFETGRTLAALNTIRKHYGGLVARGATTVWEDWAGGSSRSHGWGAGPTCLLGKYILGVEPTAPGFTEFNVLPALGDLPSARGRVPTPHGAVEVAWERTESGVSLSVLVPPGTSCCAGLPADVGDGKLRRGGQAVPCKQTTLRRGRYATCPLGPGRHRLEIPC